MMNSTIVRHLCFFVVTGAVSAAGQNSVAVAAGASPAEGETVRVLVGKAVVINVQAPLTRVLSSNPAAVETLATSPTQVVVEGKAAGNSSLILWDETGRSQMLDVVVDLDVAGLRTAIEHAYPDQNISVQADGSRLILSGSAKDPRMVEDLKKMA